MGKKIVQNKGFLFLFTFIFDTIFASFHEFNSCDFDSYVNGFTQSIACPVVFDLRSIGRLNEFFNYGRT